MESISKKMKINGLAITLLLSLFFSGSLFANDLLKASIPNEKDVILTFGHSTKDSLSKRINILVWNLHKGENTTFGTDFSILANHKDLILSEEIYLTALMRTVFDSFPDYYYASATSFFYGKEPGRTGVATSSPVKPSSINYIRTETLEPVIDSPKVTLITRYPIQSSGNLNLLTVVNIHGINFVDGASYKKEMDRIYQVIKDIPGPLIFAGDFNSWDDQRFQVLKEMSQKLGLHEASFSPDNRMKFHKHPLDHFYYTSDIKLISAKVEDSYQGSDHKPLEMIVEYSPPVRNR